MVLLTEDGLDKPRCPLLQSTLSKGNLNYYLRRRSLERNETHSIGEDDGYQV